MECLECAIHRPVSAAADMIGRREGAKVSDGGQRPAPQITSASAETDHICPLTGISCLDFASSVESLPSFCSSGTKASFRRLTQMRGCGACLPSDGQSRWIACSRLWALAGPVRTHHVYARFQQNPSNLRVLCVPGRRSLPSITDVWFIRAKSASW